LSTVLMNFAVIKFSSGWHTATPDRFVPSRYLTYTRANAMLSVRV
jgi:hypothetical protein